MNEPIETDSLDAASPPSVPSAWQLERAVSDYQRFLAGMLSETEAIEDEGPIAIALADVDVPAQSDDEPTQHAKVVKLLTQLIDAAVWSELRANEAKTLEYEFNARRLRYEERTARLRMMIDDFMRATGISKHAGRLAKASFITTQPSVIITDEGLIPDEYIRITRTPSKTALKDDLQQGVVIPGATLSNGGSALTLRRIK